MRLRPRPQAYVWCLGLFLTASTAVAQVEPRSVIVSGGPVAKTGTARAIRPAKLYWADHAGNAIKRSNLDGSEVEVVAAAVEGPYGISYDPATGYLLWTSEIDEVVQATLADGTGSVITLGSSFEESFAFVADTGGQQAAYGVVDGQVVKVTVDPNTGVETRDVLYVLASPETVHGMALAPDQMTLYLGDVYGRMSQKLGLWNRCLQPLLYVDSPPTATASQAAASTTKFRPLPCPVIEREVAQ